jgi:hypothetical protein
VTTETERRLRAQIRAHNSWADTPDRPARTAAARRALEDRFVRQADPEGKLSPQERHLKAEHVRKAYYANLALKSVQARRRRQQVGA